MSTKLKKPRVPHYTANERPGMKIAAKIILVILYLVVVLLGALTIM